MAAGALVIYLTKHQSVLMGGSIAGAGVAADVRVLAAAACSKDA